jgi:hypothetical protein
MSLGAQMSSSGFFTAGTSTATTGAGLHPPAGVRALEVQEGKKGTGPRGPRSFGGSNGLVCLPFFSAAAQFKRPDDSRVVVSVSAGIFGTFRAARVPPPATCWRKRPRP